MDLQEFLGWKRPNFTTIPQEFPETPCNRLFGNLRGIGIHVVLFAGWRPQKAPHVPSHHRISQRPL
jgi:hypothetical protein